MARADRPPPPEVRSLLPEADPLLLSIPTDLALDGAPAEEWLLVQHDRLAAGSATAEGNPRLALSLADVTKFRVDGTIGSGFLQAQVNGTWIDVLRFSQRFAGRFARVARALERIRIEPGLDHLLEIREPRCPQCDLPIAFETDACPRCIDHRAVALRLADLLRDRRRPLVIIVALLAFSIGMQMLPPKLQQILVDDVLLVDDPSRFDHALTLLAVVVATLAASRLLGAVLGAVRSLIGHRVGVDLVLDLRRRVVAKLHALPVAFHDKNQTGILVTRVIQDTEVLHNLVMQVANGFLLQLLQFVGVGVMLFVLDAKLALYTLLPAPLVVAGSAYYWRRVHPKHYRWVDAYTKHAGTLSGMMAGIRVVKAFTREAHEMARFDESGDSMQSARMSVFVGGTTYGATMGMVFSLGGLLVWYIGGLDVLGRSMTLGELMAFLAYLGLFYAPLSSLTQLTTWMSTVTSATNRIFEILDTPAEAAEPTSPARFGVDDRDVVLEGVTFGYEPHAPALEDITLTIPAGQMVGIVGKSGSGKTTLANLLCRFYDPDEGVIRIGGHDLRDMSRRDLRRHVGVVLQETFLFRGTVFENVVYGDPATSIERAIAATMAARAHDFITKLPFGYDSPIAERGSNVSGGERQRIAIARALVYDPAILILDEATSALDTETERAVQDALFALGRGRTTLAIAHRLSTLRHADRILVFEDHRLVEDGSHDELVAADGVYARLVRLQSRIASTASVDVVDAAADVERPPEIPKPRWLSPGVVKLERGRHEGLIAVVDEQRYEGVRATRLFPATLPGRYVSILAAGGDEIGIIPDLEELADADPAGRALVEEALGRRYHIAIVERVDDIVLEAGLLRMSVHTDRGSETLWMRWAQTETQDFGRAGKMLIDVDKNYWLVPDVSALPAGQRALFGRFVYW